MFLKKSTSSAGLQDTMGRTFLHIAAENNKVRIVSFVCRNQSLSWILNIQDYDGNTALHLAIQAGSLLMFCALLGNRQIHLNISNKKGQTALDISRYKIPPGLFDDQNSETRIHYALKVVHARSGNCRRDHFEENYNHQLKHTQREELKNMKESTQTLCIGAVLIATVTFGATFALPGGYRDDEHTNGGTPTLAGRYAFDAFILASTLSFILSAMSIVGLMYSGYSILNPHSRRIYLLVALYFASMSITCFMVAFALGLYMVLAPVAHKSAITICKSRGHLQCEYPSRACVFGWVKTDKNAVQRGHASQMRMTAASEMTQTRPKSGSRLRDRERRSREDSTPALSARWPKSGPRLRDRGRRSREDSTPALSARWLDGGRPPAFLRVRPRVGPPRSFGALRLLRHHGPLPPRPDLP
ncbi:protein ACCELERATED CELL DEATH 6-like [Lolium rigidum]|uniref:protein ACCELERATED CELL DEATH 6-like n=1 Tax=Lolium rigidum TaxID=89674 RepID=UPI001F5D7A80|nr:protein ACCELERATED CELL DEATH 6-like [Lolium rigidum]